MVKYLMNKANMLNKTAYLYIFSAFFLTASFVAFADGTVPVTHDKPSLNTVVVPEVQISPSSSNAAAELNDNAQKQEIIKRHQMLLQIYKQAVELYKNKKYHPAQDAFKQVESMELNYRDSSNYLKKINQVIVKQDAWDTQRMERQRKAQFNRSVRDIYGQAVVLYDSEKWAEAKKKFEEASGLIHNYKSTNRYLDLINKAILNEQQEALQEQNKEEEMARQRQLEASVKPEEDVVSSMPTPVAAVKTPGGPSLVQIEPVPLVERVVPSPVPVIAIATPWAVTSPATPMVVTSSPPAPEVVTPPSAAPEVVTPPSGSPVVVTPAPSPIAVTPYSAAPVVVIPPTPPAVVTTSTSTPSTQESALPVPMKAAISLEDQQKQAQDIVALAEKSAQLYRRVADMANDESTSQTKKKMAEVNGILNNLKEDRKSLLRQMREAQLKRQEEESKSQAENRAKAEEIYQEGWEYLRSHDYAKAKIKFIELEDINPDYKSTRRYLGRIEEQLKREALEAASAHEQNEAGNFSQLQNEENVEELSRIRKEQEDEQHLEQQQQASLKELTQKASDINDDIIRLSHQQDYEAMKEKFIELENVVNALATLKDQIADQKVQARERRLDRASMRRRIISEKQEVRQIQLRDNGEVLKENRPAFQSSDVEPFKRREIIQEQNSLFNEGVDRYEHKKYTQAKLLFDELAAGHDSRAEAWLKKVSRAITQELLKSQEAEERERTAFIADQLKAQRQLLIIQGRERQRQKKLTEELERQKRLYEDNRLLQLRKEETMKAQERERQFHEEKRLKLEKESEKQQEMFRFHKVEVDTGLRPPASKPISGIPPVVDIIHSFFGGDQPEQAERLTQEKKPREEALHQPEVKPQAPPAVVKPTVVQPAVVHLPIVQAAVVQPPVPKSNSGAPPLVTFFQHFFKGKQAQVEPEELTQKQNAREESLNQQGQEREERIRQKEILHEEEQRRQELELQEHQSQAQLEAQREIVRKQLEDGVEAMYQEALRLYKQGDYAQAADKFKDVQDILPGYKRSGQYMDEAKLKFSIVKPQAVAPDASEGTTNVSTTMPIAASASPSVSRQQSISKALDLFDPNAK